MKRGIRKKNYRLENNSRLNEVHLSRQPFYLAFKIGIAFWGSANIQSCNQYLLQTNYQLAKSIARKVRERLNQKWREKFK